MEEAGFIKAAEREAAAVEVLNFRRPGSEHFAPYFVEYVRQMLVAKYGESMVYKGGLEVSPRSISRCRGRPKPPS